MPKLEEAERVYTFNTLREARKLARKLVTKSAKCILVGKSNLKQNTNSKAPLDPISWWSQKYTSAVMF